MMYINNKIFYQFEVVPYGQDCLEGKEVLKIPINIYTFYYCENIKYIVEEVCEDSISTSVICCQKECLQK